jgi:hypothetical protein
LKLHSIAPAYLRLINIIMHAAAKLARIRGLLFGTNEWFPYFGIDPKSSQADDATGVSELVKSTWRAGTTVGYIGKNMSYTALHLGTLACPT